VQRQLRDQGRNKAAAHLGEGTQRGKSTRPAGEAVVSTVAVVLVDGVGWRSPKVARLVVRGGGFVVPSSVHRLSPTDYWTGPSEEKTQPKNAAPVS
jgi:hypothetical protein